MNYLSIFTMPRTTKITSRSSSITNAFVNAIIPSVRPSEAEVEEALDLLGMSYETVCCAYCGDQNSEWDHFRPIVKDKKPTGYVSEIRNLVPACGKCNQSKGNKHWKTWILSNAKKSPKSRNVGKLEERIANLERFENWPIHMQLNFTEIVSEKDWDLYWENCEEIKLLMKKSQDFAVKIKNSVILT